MLELRNITKCYDMNGTKVDALKGVSIAFRQNEFVAILGHSGCGKTTLLNIIGGLDHYTNGDLIINDVSTKKYNDKDWDAYRNHSVGFVFQSYNLIPHQTVLSNVELALTISGVSKSERRKRAKEALEKVGLGDQLNKKPNQMSGGQMQRVAIARALVNNPDILLADEPTGALDSETSVQVMDILKEIAKEKLVIMVTHNPELADEYATRIVRIKDGLLTSDSNPVDTTEKEAEIKKQKHVSMSLLTAFSLSLNNLMTKKGRTFMTAFAGSIGIIGIALILSLSNGINTYINKVQEDTLSSYPITLDAETADSNAMISSMMETNQEHMSAEREEDKVYANTIMYDMMNSMTSSALVQNNLEKFKDYLDSDKEIQKYISEVQYVYNPTLPIYTEDVTGKIIKTDFIEIMSGAMGTGMDQMMNSQYSMFSTLNIWDELLSDEKGNLSDMVKDKYDLIHGHWPKEYNEVVLIVDKNNEISDLILYCIGLKDNSELPELINAAVAGEEIEFTKNESWTFDEIYNKEFKLILPADHYKYSEELKSYQDMSLTDAGLEYMFKNDDLGVNLKICGVIQPSEDAPNMTTSAFGYTNALTQYILAEAEKNEIINAQLKDQTVDVFTGLPFLTEDTVLPEAKEKVTEFKEYTKGLKENADNTALKAEMYKTAMSIPDKTYLDGIVENSMKDMTREEIESSVATQYAENMGVSSESVMDYIKDMDDETLFGHVEEAIRQQATAQYAEQTASQLSQMPADQLALLLMTTEFSEEQYVALYDEYVPAKYSEADYEENLELLGYVNIEEPSRINIYSLTFEDKDKISELIEKYNDKAEEDDKITYTDYVALLMSSITDIISGVSYLLIAFVGISLVVSSIMIGIITYISVLERTREIGILRAIGASKKDISHVFNAETLLVGFTAGFIGIVVSILLNFPINGIIHSLTNLDTLNSELPAVGAVVLVCISMFLTFIAGLIPARFAAKKDPVTALRTE